MDGIDITGIDRGALLAALHNGTAALGMGVLHDIGRDMTPEEGRLAVWRAGVGDDVRFDYICGRPIKVRFDGDVLLRADLYDCDCPTGEGSCARIVESLRAKAT